MEKGRFCFKIEGARIPSSLTHYRLAMAFGNRKDYFRGCFQFSIVSFSKYHPFGNLKFDYLGISQSLKLRILMEKILSISLKLNFTPNTFGLLWVKKELTKDRI